MGILEPVGAGQVDDDAVLRRLDRCRAVVVEADEDNVRPCGERVLVRAERGQRPVPVPREPWVERFGRPAREGVRPENDELE